MPKDVPSCPHCGVTVRKVEMYGQESFLCDLPNGCLRWGPWENHVLRDKLDPIGLTTMGQLERFRKWAAIHQELNLNDQAPVPPHLLAK